MKFRILTMLLAALVITGFTACGAAGSTLDAAADAVEERIDQAEDALEGALQTSAAPAPTGGSGELTREQAQAIALEHAGFTADQVTYLRTEYEIDDGRPQYEVQFHQDRWEYDYEIDAQTGRILSFDKDD